VAGCLIGWFGRKRETHELPFSRFLAGDISRHPVASGMLSGDLAERPARSEAVFRIAGYLAGAIGYCCWLDISL